MRSEGRPEPVIPDHEVLRRIGGGAYGEVWLARAVTGALRAVKVVWREDFEDERGFEREFEGILKFEPISRDHPGLMNILHVGRSPVEPAFYYCVMELGDDVRNGREINPIDYEPRTLRGDIQAAGGKAMPVSECVEVGLRLAEGLDHLHHRGLAHRDIKPSNVIFVAGNAKLADIGLVAARGQRTFVGTEGFVPPEGPGSARADVYSLGKVLYECATGKDRLEFPDPPDELPDGGELKLWQALNRMICDVCEPHASRRRLQTAGELAEALRSLKKGRRPQIRSRAGTWLTTFGVAALLLYGGWEALQRSPWRSWVSLGPQIPSEDPGAPEIGQVRITSYPEGADVFNEDGERIGTTPMAPMEVEVGQRITVTVRKEGYRPFVVDEIVGAEAVSETVTFGQEMEVYAPPEEGQPWSDHVGMRYQPVNSHHVSSALVPVEVWMQYIENTGWDGKLGKLKHTESGEEVTVVAVDAGAATSFCEWLATEGLRLGYLTMAFEVRAEFDANFDTSKLPPDLRKAGLKPFRTVVEPIRYATLVVTTEPAGAEVYIDDVPEGFTGGPLEIGRLKPGTYEVQLVLEGYRPKVFELKLGPNQRIERNEKLQPNRQSVVMTRPWENGLGMRFVPVDKDLMACVWETRVRDFDTFVSASESVPPLKPEFPQEDDHPVVYVSREEAQEFCAWLTLWERESERITLTHEYRLPTDLEWSLLVGLREDPDATPAGRSAGAAPVFPWGPLWPPGTITGEVGNLADESAMRMPGISPDRVIAGYNDGFEATSPVGGYPGNELGLFDLSGNVHEWVSDNYTLRGDLGVLRGGGWNTFEEENLYSGSRNTAPPRFHDNIYGFRVMLAKVPAEPAPDPDDDPFEDPGEDDEPDSDNTTSDG